MRIFGGEGGLLCFCSNGGAEVHGVANVGIVGVRKLGLKPRSNGCVGVKVEMKGKASFPLKLELLSSFFVKMI